MIIASANVGSNDFARAAKEIDRAIAKAGQAPRGVTTQVRGQGERAQADLYRVGHTATLATLFLLPTVFGIVQKGASLKSSSLDPASATRPLRDRGHLSKKLLALWT
jgi:hypothetical protein